MRSAACWAPGSSTSRRSKSKRAKAYNGGNWGNGANAGLFYLNVNNSASNANTNIGGRLANDKRQKPAAHGLSASAFPLGPLS